MKGKTPTQKYIDQAVAVAKEELSGTHISHCNIEMPVHIGESITLVAEGLIENAKALGVLAGAIAVQKNIAINIEAKK